MILGPDELLAQRRCVAPVSKDVQGEVHVVDVTRQACSSPACEPMVVVQHLRLKLTTHACDSSIAIGLDGTMLIRDLVTIFAQPSERTRGVHAGKIYWTPSAGGRIVGTVAGITNGGVFRRPAVPDGEDCDAIDVLSGHLSGVGSNLLAIPVPEFLIEAEYRLTGKSNAVELSTSSVAGVLEGVLLQPCRA